jgi:endonuclease/exonuclease/phosphatase family metal-dependent hydrolase
MVTGCLTLLLLLASTWGMPLQETPELDKSEQLSVVVYNVENLFDIDGIALFDDYQPELYPAAAMRVKVQNIARVLAQVDQGKGPDIILFQELEADQTPATTPHDYPKLLAKYSEPLDQLLEEPIRAEVRDLPSQFFLLKALEEQGLKGYHVEVAEYRQDPSGRVVAHVNATFSRPEIESARTLQSPGARGTLEVVHVGPGYRFRTFNNHWKSGASDATAEEIRVGNAQALRSRIDELFSSEPKFDAIIGGDFNSQYNQSERFPKFKITGINDVLKSQGLETSLTRAGSKSLYNLWYELPTDMRGSDAYRDEWGTLMQMILTPGLYDYQGIQYVNGSFKVLAFSKLNAQAETGLPIRWQAVGDQAAGFSDHLPLLARFRICGTIGLPGFQPLDSPGEPNPADAEPRRVEYEKINASKLPPVRELGTDAKIQTADNLGQLYLVEAEVSGERPFRIRVFEDEYNLWAFDVDLRRKIYARFKVGEKIKIAAELGAYQGNWQFVIRHPDWLEP